jgi:AcrR family transcriptional regulator
LIRRCDSAATVPKTSDDLPDPETPVKTVSRRLGMSSETSRRLFSRAPRTSMTSWLSAVGSGDPTDQPDPRGPDADRAGGPERRDADPHPPAQPGPRGPGRRPGLSVDLIVDAAIAVADAHGMTGLSMRAVGDRLDRTGMALYTYVRDKSELIELMYDKALAELPTDYPTAAGWRPAVTSWTTDLCAFYLRHPWVLQVSQARPVLGPNDYVLMETVLRLLVPTGLPAPVLRRIVSALFHLARGVAQTIAETREASAVTGVSDEDWWYARSALLDEVAPDFAERFPTVTRLEREKAFDMDDETVPYLEQEAREAFTTGLDVLLDGVEVAIARHQQRVDADGPAGGQGC